MMLQRILGFTCLIVLIAVSFPSSLAATSLGFFVNAAADYDYAHQLALPPGFGQGEFTLELWILPDDNFPVGPTSSGADQRQNWSNADEEPYSSGTWWFEGNFLLDGHNNDDFIDGTFSLQFYGGGRVRWLFGDGVSAGPGGHWSVGAFPATGAPSLLDGSWHQVTLVRRFVGVSAADLELWIDGQQIAVERSSVRTDMRSFWDAWTGFPIDQEGWFWGVEKQAAIGVLAQYEDFKGLLDEVRFWNRARTSVEIMNEYWLPVTGVEPGLSGVFRFSEASGTQTCDVLDGSRCMALIDMKTGFWSTDGAPPEATFFSEGFATGDLSRWSAPLP